MINYLKEGYKEKILINSEDENQLIAGRNFLITLEKLNKDFVANVDKAQREFDDFNKNKINEKVIFKPEVLTRKSPMTLIDAKWGSGKTYFVETLLKNLALDKFEGVSFKNAILIDAWKVSMSKESVARLFKNLFEKLGTIYPQSKKEKLIKFGETAFEYGKDYTKDKFKIKQVELEGIEKGYEKGIKKIIKDNGTTLIFIDNIERVGRDAWDILKGISKLLVLRGFVVVLPLNLQKMHKAYEEDYKKDGSDNSHIENPIEKYLDIKYFEFRQDYMGLLRKLGFNEEDCTYYNKVLETTDNSGQIMSVREVEKRVVGSGILKINDPSSRKILFQNNIWNSKEIFEEEIKNDISNCAEDINEIFAELKNKISEMKIRASRNNRVDLVDKITLHNRKELDFRICESLNNLKIINEYEKDFNLLIKKIINENNITENKISVNKLNIITKNKEIDEILFKIENLKNEKEIMNSKMDLLQIKESKIKENELSYKKSGELKTTSLKRIEQYKIDYEKFKNKRRELVEEINFYDSQLEKLRGEIMGLEYLNESDKEKIIKFENVNLDKLKSMTAEFQTNYKNNIIFKELQNKFINKDSLFEYEEHLEILPLLLEYDSDS